jgi:hypothetical protein
MHTLQMLRALLCVFRRLHLARLLLALPQHCQCGAGTPVAPTPQQSGAAGKRVVVMQQMQQQT